MEAIYSATITAIAMLISNYISYRISISSRKFDIEKLKIETENSNKKEELEEKLNAYSQFLGLASKTFYLTTQESMEDYLIAYRRFSLLCPTNANPISREIHADVVNSCSVRTTHSADFENKLNSLVKILQVEVQHKIDISQ